jgi:hypothetical protein
MEKLNRIADDLVWEMFTDSGSNAESGQEFLGSQYQNIPEEIYNPLILKINEVTSNPIIVSLWDRKVLTSEFSCLPYETYLEENLSLSEEEVKAVTELSAALDNIFEPI